MGPDDLPVASALILEIGVPVVAQGHVLTTDDDFEAGPIANHHRLALDLDGDLGIRLEAYAYDHAHCGRCADRRG